MDKKISDTELNSLTEKIIGTAIDVHKELGPGLLESAYQKCLAIALEEKGLKIQTEVPVELFYHNHKISDEAFRIDILVENTIVIELKSVSKLTEVFSKQVGTYLKIGNYPCGLLINFNEVLLKDGIKRIINTKLN